MVHVINPRYWRSEGMCIILSLYSIHCCPRSALLWLIYVFIILAVGVRTLCQARSQNFEKRLLPSSCLFVPSHGTTQLPRKEFHEIWHFSIFENLSRKILIKLWRVRGILREYVYTLINIFRSDLLTRRYERDVSDKSFRENKNTHVTFSNLFFFFTKTVPFMK